MSCKVQKTAEEVMRCEEEDDHVYCYECYGINWPEMYQESLVAGGSSSFPIVEDRYCKDHINETSGKFMFGDKVCNDKPLTMSQFFAPPMKKHFKMLL